MNTKQSRASFCMALGMLAMGNSGHVLAQEDTSLTSVPHTFESGDVISAEQMNNNFSAIAEKFATIASEIAEIKASSETGQPGFIIKDAGTFAGSISTAESGGNFSLLPGADGATGVAAADAACEANYPGSHAEMDALVLWKSAVTDVERPVELPDGRYWTSSKTDIPLVSSFDDGGSITSSCDDWTNDDQDDTRGPEGNTISAKHNYSGEALFVNFNRATCLSLSSSASFPDGFHNAESNPLIACYKDQ